MLPLPVIVFLFFCPIQAGPKFSLARMADQRQRNCTGARHARLAIKLRYRAIGIAYCDTDGRPDWRQRNPPSGCLNVAADHASLILLSQTVAVLEAQESSI